MFDLDDLDESFLCVVCKTAENKVFAWISSQKYVEDLQTEKI
jgi:hypothetical protein